VVASNFEQTDRRVVEAFVFVMRYPNHLLHYAAHRNTFENVPSEACSNDDIHAYMRNFADAYVSNWLYESREELELPKQSDYRVDLKEVSSGMLALVCFSKTALEKALEMKAVTACQQLKDYLDKFVARRFGSIDGKNIAR